MQSVVRVDPHQVQEWVGGLLHEQDQGKTEELAYTPAKTTANVVNDTDINGLATSVLDVLSAKGFTAGSAGNNDGGHVKGSQVRAAKTEDLGAQEVARQLGGLPVVADASIPTGIGSGGAGQRLHRSGLRARGRGRSRPHTLRRSDPATAPAAPFPRRRRSSPPARKIPSA